MAIRLNPRRSACIRVIRVLFAAPVTDAVRAGMFRPFKKLVLLSFLLHVTLHASEAAGQDSQSPYTERVRKEFKFYPGGKIQITSGLPGNLKVVGWQRASAVLEAEKVFYHMTPEFRYDTPKSQPPFELQDPSSKPTSKSTLPSTSQRTRPTSKLAWTTEIFPSTP